MILNPHTFSLMVCMEFLCHFLVSDKGGEGVILLLLYVAGNNIEILVTKSDKVFGRGFKNS